MKVERVPTANGIHDIKLIGENELERQFIKQLAEAGTLSCTNRQVADTIVFRAISVIPEISDYTSSKNSIGKYNFILRQNENHSFDLDFKTNKNPIDLNQYPTIKLQIKRQKSSSAIVELSLGSGLIISGSNSNVLTVVFTAEQTKQLACDTYYYDILMSKPTQNLYYIEGTVTVKKSATR
ncbi:hypothetical protein [Flavobacterium sp. T12S277]|uniref:hypothetical protein n=1 Tax=Flavobacterium sp. T12S277 TaxID=3402752 RepID=UPI003ADEBFB1